MYQNLRVQTTGMPPQIGDTWYDASYLTDLIVGNRHALRSDIEVTHWIARWAQCGYPQFELTHSLAAALAMTDCRGVRWGDFKFPFPSFMVQLPHPTGPLSFLGADDKTVVSGRWILVHSMRVPVPKSGLSALGKTFYPGAAEALSQGDYGPMARLIDMASGHSEFRHRAVCRLLSQEGPSIYNHADILADDQSVSNWLDVSIRPDEPLENRDVWAIQTTSRLVTNLCIYLAEQVRSGDLSGDAPRPRMNRSGGMVVPSIVLGREIKLPAELRDAARACCEQGINAPKWQVHSRCTVRGHWRRQACGTGRLERRMKWIAPHWRGPDAGTLIRHNYQVDLQPPVSSGETTWASPQPATEEIE